MRYLTSIITILSIPSSSVKGRLLEASPSWFKLNPEPQDVKGKEMSPEARIVGGAIASQGDFPWFVASSKPFFCGGSLVLDDIVLSAAHCPFENGTEVYVGAVIRESDYGGAQKRTVTEVLRHPDFDQYQLWNDVMLMKLDSPVEHVDPIVLNTDQLVPEPGETLTTMGFGHLEEGGNRAYFLREVNITAFSFQICERQYENILAIDGIKPLVLDEEIQICSGYSLGGRDTCQGDSGGPLVTSDGVQVGIVSGSLRCASANFAGIYARVSAVTDFIEQGVCSLSSNSPISCGDSFWRPPS